MDAVLAGGLLAADDGAFHGRTGLHLAASNATCLQSVIPPLSIPTKILRATVIIDTVGSQVHAVLAGGGVDADDGDFHGRTALHLAASNGHLATARRLVLGEARRGLLAD